MLVITQFAAFLLSIVYGVMLLKELWKGKAADSLYIIRLSFVFMVPAFIGSLALMVVIGNTGELVNFPASVASGLSGIILSTYLFNLLIDRFNQNWLRGIYYLSIMFTFVAAIAMMPSLQYRPMFEQLFEGIMIILSLIIGCTIPFAILAWLISLFMPDSRLKKDNTFRHYNQNKVHHYRSHGLSDSDIQFFREQMAEAKDHIQNIEESINAVAKLRVIETRHNTIDVMKQFFKDIVQEPERLPQVGIFLNKLLPSLEDLSAKYVEISSHVAKNKQTYLILDKSATTIEKICESITEQYLAFHQSAYNELDDEIKLANKNLSKVSDTVTADGVDELVSDPFAFDE